MTDLATSKPVISLQPDNLPLAVYQEPAVRELQEQDRMVQKIGKDGKIHVVMLDKVRVPLFDPHPTKDQNFIIKGSPLHLSCMYLRVPSLLRRKLMDTPVPENYDPTLWHAVQSFLRKVLNKSRHIPKIF